MFRGGAVPYTPGSKSTPIDSNARLLRLVELAAAQSLDRSRRVGAVIVGADGEPLVFACNGFPRGVADREERHVRPEKYAWTIHAEIAAICAAARAGISTEGVTMVVNWFPCAECARAIVQSGIGKLVAFRPDLTDPRWGADFKIAREMLEEAGVELQLCEAPKEEETP